MLHYLMYVSKSAKAMERADLEMLLVDCRRKNEANHITGMLLYIKGEFLGNRNGRFIQVLEGAEDILVNLIEKIKLDARHTSVTVVNMLETPKRNFENWSMGLEIISIQDYQDRAGSFELDRNFGHLDKDDRLNVPLSLLKSFYNATTL